jgi:hypothetical protein
MAVTCIKRQKQYHPSSSIIYYMGEQQQSSASEIPQAETEPNIKEMSD